VKSFIISPETDPAVEGPRQGEWAYADWENLLNDGNRYEIIDGYIYMTTAPSNFHQWIISRLMKHVGFPAEDQESAYFFVAPIGVLMPGCDPVQPDFLIVLKENEVIIHDGRIRGVPEYAVIDPHERKLRLYALEDVGAYAEPRAFVGDERVKFACLPSIEFRLSTLFENAPDTTV
jgi:Uma2 family endonuclease